MTGRTLQNTKVSGEEEAGGAPSTRGEIPLQPTVKTMVRQDVLLQPMEICGGAEIWRGAMLEQVNTQRRL